MVSTGGGGADTRARLSVMEQTQTPTLARANGLVISRLLDTAARAQPAPGPLDWMDWERQKTLRLLRSAV